MVSDGEKGVQRMYQFTGTVTSRARCLGRKLLFLTGEAEEARVLDNDVTFTLLHYSDSLRSLQLF